MSAEHTGEFDGICPECAERERREAENRKRLRDLLHGVATPPASDGAS